EMDLLHNRFPENIKLFSAHEGSAMRAGIIIYDCGSCVHGQYLCNSKCGMEIGALDAAIEHAIDLYKDRKYFNFGISTEQQRRVLNEGLARQKEGFGGRSIVHHTYELSL